MKQVGQCIVGDFNRVDSYTIDWFSVKVHPCTFYRRLDQFKTSFKKIKGFYAELDAGQYVIVRFSNKEDVTEFHRFHHEYI